MEHSQEKGYVYILTNPSFREDWVKIGKSARPVEKRIKELDNTAVPQPFEIYATIQTTKYNDVEKYIHQTIDQLSPDKRIRRNREFFNVKPQVVLDIFRNIASMLDDAVITIYKDNKPIEGAQCACTAAQEPTIHAPKRGRFKFSMVGIPIGETITFAPNGASTGIEVKVASDDTVEYEGHTYKLSPFVRIFMPENQRNTSGAYQGAKHFIYKGRVLDDLRREIEKTNQE